METTGISGKYSVKVLTEVVEGSVNIEVVLGKESTVGSITVGEDYVNVYETHKKIWEEAE